jgi:hypothetical protein
MRDDLIKRLREGATWDDDIAAADRIEQLERERDGYLAERNNFEFYLQRTHADLELEVAAVDALAAKLAKAVSLALEECPFGYGTGGYNDWWYDRRAVLAELEKQ